MRNNTRRPLTIIIALLLMAAIAAIPLVFSPKDVGWSLYPGPPGPAAPYRLVASVFAALQLLLNALLLIPVAGLIWSGIGWARYIFVVQVLMGLAENAVSRSIFNPEVLALAIAALLSAGLLFAPSANLWLKDKQND
jgi:hypothetical protein